MKLVLREGHKNWEYLGMCLIALSSEVSTTHWEAAGEMKTVQLNTWYTSLSTLCALYSITLWSVRNGWYRNTWGNWKEWKYYEVHLRRLYTIVNKLNNIQHCASITGTSIQCHNKSKHRIKHSVATYCNIINKIYQLT